ncbi:MAG: C39 family peptidase [Shewanella sp.]
MLRFIWFLCFSLAGGHLWAAEVDLSQSRANVGFNSKSVLSIMEQRFVGIERQNTDFSCGAAALATILQSAYGQRTNEYRVMSGMLALADPRVVERLGFSMLDMKNYVQMLGMRARGYQLSIDELRMVRVPTIALLNLRGYQHFVVLRAIDNEDLVYLADPALGNRIIELDEFIESWNGILLAIIGDGYRKQNALVNPKPPLSLRGAGPLFAPVTESHLLEFGFQHKNLL